MADLAPSTPEAPTPLTQTITVSQVSKFYGDVVAVSDISFSLDAGVTALLGPNGAGKSTLLEMLTGLLSPSSGKIQILGRPVRGDKELYRKVGLVPEQEHLYPFLTAREFLHLNAILQDMPEPERAVQRALEVVELVDDADRKLGGYSKGMRQRAKIAAALVHDPEVILMDEPLSGTDPLQRLRIIELINELGSSGRTVLISSHVLDEVERFADRILVIVNGKLAAAGNFHTIRDRMDEQANRIRVKTSDPRRFAAALIRDPSVYGVAIDPGDLDGRGGITVESGDVRAFYRSIARLAAEHDVTLYEVSALDDSLTSVFAYVVGR